METTSSALNKATPISSDHQLMKALSSLVELESKDIFDAGDFVLYRSKTKNILEVLLAKLEDNHEYHLYLEEEVRSLETKCSETELEYHSKTVKEQVL